MFPHHNDFYFLISLLQKKTENLTTFQKNKNRLKAAGSMGMRPVQSIVWLLEGPYSWFNVLLSS